MKLTKTIILTAFLTSLGGTAIAADAPKTTELPKFEAVDTNGDKSLDADEFSKATAAGVKKTFAELDKNKDGKLSKEEYSVVLDEDCE